MIGRVEDVVRLLGGRRVGYLWRGPALGHTVVYLHGMPGCRREQLLFSDQLLERMSIRLLSIDRPGWGETDALSGDRVARAADVLGVCDILGVESFPLLAVSAGGSYALTLAAMAPTRVERVVLASAQMPYDDETALTGLLPDQLALLTILQRGRTTELVNGVESWRHRVLADPLEPFASAVAALTDRERRLIESPEFSEILLDSMRVGLRQGAAGALDDLLAWPVPFEVDLADVTCPVSAFHGSADNWEPLQNLQRVLDTLPNSQIMTAQGLNHFAPELFPQVVLALTR